AGGMGRRDAEGRRAAGEVRRCGPRGESRDGGDDRPLHAVRRADGDPVLVPRRRAPWRRGAAGPRRRMTQPRARRFGGQAEWLLASGDFTPLGGMDRANYALAGHLAARGDTVHLVAHRVADDLARRRGIVVHLVPRPLGAHLLGAPLLARAAARRRRALPDARALMNGGNGIEGVPTRVHDLHAAYAPAAASFRTRASASAGRRYHLAREEAALRAAPLVICNSRVTAEDVQRHYGVPASKTVVVYYGIDAAAFAPASESERLAARERLGIPAERPLAIFIGALGDRRKGFDLLFDAWRSLAAAGDWSADLIVAGAGAERGAWASRTRAAGLTGVRVLGFRTDVASLLAAADILVHPSRYEAYGL